MDPTCAVIVTYNGTPDLAEVAFALGSQVGLLIIVNNGCPEELLVPALERLPCAAIVHHHALNMGVAIALNCGLSLARSAGYSWALLSDQDSRPKPTLVAELQEVCRRATSSGLRVGLVGPNWTDTRTGRTAYRTHTPRDRGWHKVSHIITSGTLLSLDAHSALGPFAESWFIDSVDTEYCFRSHLSGWSVIASGKVLMKHEIGARAGKAMPWRMYYLARNALWLMARYGLALPGPSVKIFFHWVRFVFGTLLHSTPESAVRYWMWRGVRDGICPNRTRWDPFPNITSDALNNDHAVNH